HKAGRGFLLQYLADSTQERVWYDISSILKDLYKQHPGIMRTNYSYLSKRQREVFAKNPQQCMQTDGETYIGMIGGVLFEMGIVDLGYAQTGQALDGKPPLNSTALRL